MHQRLVLVTPLVAATVRVGASGFAAAVDYRSRRAPNALLKIGGAGRIRTVDLRLMRASH